MTRKRDIDQRQEPSDGGGTFRVDRVFIPKAQPRPTSTADVVSPPTRARTPSVSPDSADLELSLRRSLSRLQRQLAEAQRELANKDDELASEVEKRQAAFAAHDALIEDQRHAKVQLDQLVAYEARTQNIETRLLEAVANTEEIAHSLDRERRQRAVEQARLEELTQAFEAAQATWSAERAAADAKAAAELEQLETEKRAAIDAAEQALEAATARLRDSHERELGELRGSHERSVSALRGELEPKALEARSLAEERERLAGELVAQRNEASRIATEREETKSRELAQVAEAHAREQTTQARLFQAELARAHQERDAQTLALQQASRAADAREQGHEHELASLRDAQKKLERELAEARDRSARLETENASAEELLASATATTERLFDDKRTLEEHLHASETEARRNALDRLRFVAYLEEGLALLGALPPEADAADASEPPPPPPPPVEEPDSAAT